MTELQQLIERWIDLNSIKLETMAAFETAHRNAQETAFEIYNKYPHEFYEMVDGQLCNVSVAHVSGGYINGHALQITPITPLSGL